MLMHLFQQHEIVLYNEIILLGEEDQRASIEFLKEQFDREKIEYPGEVPEFEPTSALWAAKTLYYSSQFYLFREHDPEELKKVIAPYSGLINPSSLMSADLCLRFIPDIIFQLDLINPDDELILQLHQILKPWLFSVARISKTIENHELEAINENACLRTVFINRVLAIDNEKLNTLPLVKTWKREVCGMYDELTK